MIRLMIFVGSLLLLMPIYAASLEQWRLSIEGHHRFVYGEPVLNGYVEIPWSVALDFAVKDGEFLSGSGQAQWHDRVSSGSVPQDWIACELLSGSYLDASLQLREMPRLRFSGFPLAGRVEDDTVHIRPGYDAPGNYLAVRYGCQTDNTGADNWFTFAARAHDELGLRQDAQTEVKGDQRQAWISEVKTIPPSDTLVMPLRDGWHFQEGRDDSVYVARYRLQRLSD